MQARSSNAGKNSASARGEQPRIERDRDEDIFIAGWGATETGKSSFFNAEEPDLMGFPTAVIPTSYHPYSSNDIVLAPSYYADATCTFNVTNMSNTEQYNPSEHHISLNSTADPFNAQFNYTISLPNTLTTMDNLMYPLYQQHAEATNPNRGEPRPWSLGMWQFRCPGEDDMSSGSSINAESLFDYSPSESEATTTVGSSVVQQELTYTNIEHMLAVFKAERGKCLRELQGLDAALETIDQSEPNSTHATPPDPASYDLSIYHHDYENTLPETGVNASTKLKNKRKIRDSPEAAQLAYSGPPEHMDANPPASRKNESRAAAKTPAVATRPAAVIMTCGQSSLVPGSKTKEPRTCGRCPRTVTGIPALKRHCSEVHKQDIHGNPISVGRFPCPILACSKNTDPFKRREKLSNHIRTAHTERIEGQEVNGGMSFGERDAALITNNTTNAGHDFGANHGDTTSSFLDSASMHDFLDMGGVIDQAFMEGFPSGEEVPDLFSPSDLPESFSDFSQQIPTRGWSVTVGKTVAVPYDTIDEAKQALLDARNKTLQRLQFINQQIENLEGRKQNRYETIGGLESVNDSFL